MTDWWAHSPKAAAWWLDHASRIGEVRRAVRMLAAALGWPAHRVEEAAIVTSEMASNVVRHAGSGWLLGVRMGAAIELLALDRGPGMADPVRCFTDGFSTSGTAGIGLGAIRRLSDSYALHTRPDGGTALFARLGPAPPVGLRIGCAGRPFPGQPASGDGWRIDRRGDVVRLLVTDGLGHGPGAVRASTRADEMFAAHPSDDPVELLAALDEGLVDTRGAAATVAIIDLGAHTVSFAGVGNVAATLEAGDERVGLVPRFGVLGAGAQIDRVRAATHRWRPESRLVVHSDGISERWRAGVQRSRKHTTPAVLAGRILRDHLRRTDDALCVVLAAGEEGVNP